MNTYRYSMMKKRLAWLAALVVLVAHSVSAAIQVVGSVNATQVITDPANGNKKVVFGLTTGGQLEVSVYADDVVRVRYHWDGIWVKEDVAIAKSFDQWAPANATLSDEGNVYRIATPALEVEVVKSPTIQVHFKSPQGFYLSRDSHIEYDTQYDAVADGTYDNLRYTHALPAGFKLKGIREMPPGEAYFGFGEYAGPLNRRGHNIQGWNADTYSWQEFWNPMYMTMPFFYGTRSADGSRPAYAYGLFFNNPARPLFRMGTQWGDKYSFEAGDGQLDYFFFAGGNAHTMASVLDRYTELTGRPTMLPKWGFGYHMSRWSYSNQGWIQWLAQEFRNRDFPLDAIYIDLDYMDINGDNYYYDNTLHQLTFNGNFPDVPGMINYTAQRGVKLVPLIEPWISQGDPKWNEANSQFHFIKDYTYNTVVTPIFFGNVSWIDFSSTPARNWWKGKLVNFLNQYPVAGIWNDLNEPADNEAIPRNGQYWLDNKYPNQWDSRHFHINEKNMYCVRETSLTYDALLTKYPEKRPFVLSRAGWPGIQRYALGWSGDNVASWDHARHNIGLGVSVMMSGQANFGHDVGGFVGTTSGELLTRWSEWAALNPLFRNHSQKWDAEREPWRFDSNGSTWWADKLREIIKFRYRLMPYLYTLAHQSTVNGMAMNTPTVMHFMNDPGTHYRNDNDFMVGSHLLASPIFVQGQSQRSTYLPAGATWYNWYNDAKVEGGNWGSQNAPVGTLPLWVRAGGIIPMGPAMAHANQFVPDFMDIHVWPNPPGFSSEFTLYEDDGETWHFLAGNYAKTRLVSSTTASNHTFVIHAREGSYDTGSRDYYVKIRDVDAPTSVTVNGQPVPYDASHALDSCYSYDSGARRVVVKVPDTRQQTTVVVNSIPGYTPLNWIGNVHNWPTNGAINPTDNFWVNIESYPKDAAENVEVFYSTNSGATWASAAMNPNGTAGLNDKWNRNLGTFAFGTPVWYWMRASDSQGLTLTNNNGGAFYKVTVGVYGPQLTWVGDSHNWPVDGEIRPTDNFWVNTYTYPQAAAQLAQVVISTNEGVTWVTNAMVKAGTEGQDDWWHLNLGTFPAGTKIWYWMRAADAYGTAKVDKNNGAYYKVTAGVFGPAIVWAGNAQQYPLNGSIKASDTFWLNVDSYPRYSGVAAEAIVSTNEGVTWVTNAMNLAGVHGNDDWWNLNLGTFPTGTRIWYRMRVTDAYGTVKDVSNSGLPFKTIVGNGGPAMVWAGNLDEYPAPGNVTTNTDMWLNIETWPKGSAVTAEIIYTLGGNNSGTVNMSLAGARGNNDWWHKNLGKFGSGMTVEYFIRVFDSFGTEKRVPAEGMEAFTVNQ